MLRVTYTPARTECWKSRPESTEAGTSAPPVVAHLRPSKFMATPRVSNTLEAARMGLQLSLRLLPIPSSPDFGHEKPVYRMHRPRSKFDTDARENSDRNRLSSSGSPGCASVETTETETRPDPGISSTWFRAGLLRYPLPLLHRSVSRSRVPWISFWISTKNSRITLGKIVRIRYVSDRLASGWSEDRSDPDPKTPTTA